MRRFLALLAGALGLGAILSRRRRPRAWPAPVDPAAELRAKLAESRSIVDERDSDEAGQVTVDAAADPDPEARRRDVHDRARQALDELG